MITQNLGKILKENAYPGRGIVIGKSDDGKYAVTADRGFRSFASY